MVIINTIIKNKNLSNIKRYNPKASFGLTDAQVSCRINDGLTNFDDQIKTKTIGKIVKDNILTLFNILNFALALAIVYVGSYKNLLFLGVVVCNTIIGIFQEIKAKKAVDKLSIISQTKACVIRNGKLIKIPINNIVLDDIIYFNGGNQICADCIIMDGSCEVNESLLTGESNSIFKKPGDKLLSGSFVVSGSCKAKAEHIGSQNYAATISNSAKYIKKLNSEIMTTLNRIIKVISFIIVPLGIMLFLKQYNLDPNGYKDAVVSTVAAIVGMIPEGLVLLTSTVLAVSVIKLSRKHVLVQELYCIETLARVDVLCLDKTGTITDGHMNVDNVVPLKNNDTNDIYEIMNVVTSCINDKNETFTALKNKFCKKSRIKADRVVPFSSDRKWSGVYLKDKGSYIVGSPEFILKDNINIIKNDLDKYTSNNRVLLLAHSKSDFLDDLSLPNDIEVLSLILIKDNLRKSFKTTLDYFEKQGVDIKVISGDNVLTVSKICKDAGIKNHDSYIDASTLHSYSDILNAVDKYTIFGRVSPKQKKDIILALKEKKHTVAMTGDGVNDVLALKEADCSIAMASGSDAARNVSQLVLLDSNFDSMPKVVKEGRRSINNIQRSSSLFLVKTIYSTILAIVFLFLNMQYPFMPIQMTLTSAFTIGIPSFILSFEPTKDRLNGNFFLNILKNSLPGAITVVANILFVCAFSFMFKLPADVASTLSVILTSYTGLLILYKICKPFNLLKEILFATMVLGLSCGILVLRDIFSITELDLKLFLLLVPLVILSTIAFRLLERINNKLFFTLTKSKYNK